jgi:superoxide dismutase, Fe-Mn family
MKYFEEKKFEIPELKGISKKNIEEHLKLYSGYVKHSNLIIEKMEKLLKDTDEFSYELGELQRRFSFEFNGMRNHEHFFSGFAGGPKEIDFSGPLYGALSEEFGMFDDWLSRFKLLASTRGIGWAMLYYDPVSQRLVNAWIDEQHLGQLNNCKTILALDMWEHSYVYDYQPSGKKNYIEDFFTNLNWSVIENNFEGALRNIV